MIKIIITIININFLFSEVKILEVNDTNFTKAYSYALELKEIEFLLSLLCTKCIL